MDWSLINISYIFDNLHRDIIISVFDSNETFYISFLTFHTTKIHVLRRQECEDTANLLIFDVSSNTTNFRLLYTQ